MRAGVNHRLAWIALAAVVTTAAGAASEPQQTGENHWVPSFAITSGVTLQGQSGSESSAVFDSGTNTTRPLRTSLRDDDSAVSMLVGVSLELMTLAMRLT